MKVMLFTLCAIFAGVTAKVVTTEEDTPTLVGVEKCTQGPPHWCSLLKSYSKNSATCKATHYCIEKEWLWDPVVEDDDSVSNVCTNMIQEIRDQIENNQKQIDIMPILQNNCKLMIVQDCNTMINELYPEINEIVKSEVNSTLDCSKLELYNSSHIDELLLKHKQT